MNKVYQPLFDFLAAKTHVALTVNQRLARYLNHSCVQSYDHFVDALWSELEMQPELSLPKVLDTYQANVLWQQLLSRQQSDLPFLSLAQTVKQAQSAYELVYEYDIQLNQDNCLDEDSKLFYAWLQDFETLCEKRGWITAIKRTQWLLKHIEKIAYVLPKQITLVGFQEVTPLKISLVEALKLLGIAVHQHELETEKCPYEKQACLNEQDELYQAADWAKKQVSGGQEVGIVIDNIQSRFKQVVGVFDEVLGGELAYQITGGQPLSSYPIISDALCMLRLAYSQDPETLRQVMLSPYMTGQAELPQRAKLDRAVLEIYSGTVRLRMLLNSRILPEYAPVLAEQLVNYDQYAVPPKASIAFWGQHFLGRLKTLGWPGEYALTSLQYQVVQRFYVLLQEWLTLDKVSDACSYHQAVSLLSQLAQQTLFQPKSDPNARLTILGQLEAAGIVFDQTWVLGLHEEQFPAKPKPHPYLPVALQRQLNLPHSHHDRECAYAKGLLQGLRQCSSHMIVSYPQVIDALPVLMSPLITDAVDGEGATLTTTFKLQYHSKPEQEEIEDYSGQPLNPADAASIKGGIGIFKRQSLCPFSAYGFYRLRVQAFPEFIRYYQAFHRGQILHDIMAEFWQTTKTSQKLNAYDEAQLNQEIAKHTDKVVDQFSKRHRSILPEAFAQLEKKRLSALITSWLAIEKTREPFEVIGAEQSIQAVESGIPLNMRIDRMDQLDTGEKVIIDYKTGVTSKSGWLSSRPTEPQLPMYALHLSDISAISFANLNANKALGFDGLSDTVESIKGIKTVAGYRYAEAESWDQLLQMWQDTFKRLASAFKEGIATVDPVHVQQACTYCGLQTLCQIRDAS